MALFKTGGVYPPVADIERLSLYETMRKFYEGNHHDIYNRASELLKDSPFKDQLEKLRITTNLADVIVSKPAELLLQDPIILESGKDGDSEEQKALLRIAEENDLDQLVFSTAVGGAILGDGWLKVFYNYRQDFSELTKMGLPIPREARKEAVLQNVNPNYVFPEISEGNSNQFKAVNIAYVDWVEVSNGVTTDEIPFLYVERHLAGYVIYERFALTFEYVEDRYGEHIPVFRIGEKVPTGRDVDVVATNVPVPLMFHFPYKQTSLKWRGEGAIEKIANLLVSISDRLTSVDFILHKHSDPILQGPAIDGEGDLVRLSGGYVVKSAEDPDLKYITWEPHLQYNFQELDILLGEVFLQSQLPMWLFGTSLVSAGQVIGGTSHSDSTTTKLKYAPVAALLGRINMHLTKCFADALYYAQILENYANEDVESFTSYEPCYPRVEFTDGIPVNEKEETELTILKFQAGLLDRLTSIKKLEKINDHQAQELLRRIEKEQSLLEAVDSSLFNSDEDDDASLSSV